VRPTERFHRLVIRWRVTAVTETLRLAIPSLRANGCKEMFSRERVGYSIAVGDNVGAFQRPVLICESDVLSSINRKMPTFSFTAGLSLDEAVSHHGSRPFVSGLSALQLPVRLYPGRHGNAALTRSQ